MIELLPHIIICFTQILHDYKIKSEQPFMDTMLEEFRTNLSLIGRAVIAPAGWITSKHRQVVWKCKEACQSVALLVLCIRVCFTSPYLHSRLIVSLLLNMLYVKYRKQGSCYHFNHIWSSSRLGHRFKACFCISLSLASETPSHCVENKACAAVALFWLRVNYWPNVQTSLAMILPTNNRFEITKDVIGGFQVASLHSYANMELTGW